MGYFHVGNWNGSWGGKVTGSGALISTPENAATAFSSRLLYSRSRPASKLQERVIKPDLDITTCERGVK